MNTVSKSLIAAAVAGAMMLPASGAFAGEKTNKAILGAVIGGLAGAALGNGDKGAVAIGAVAGAAIGASTAQDRDDRRYSNSYRARPTYAGYQQGYQQGYRQPGYPARDPRHGADSRYGRGERYDARHDARYAHDYRR